MSDILRHTKTEERSALQLNFFDFLQNFCKKIEIPTKDLYIFLQPAENKDKFLELIETYRTKLEGVTKEVFYEFQICAVKYLIVSEDLIEKLPLTNPNKMPEIDIVPTNPFWDKPLKTNIPNVPTITGPNTKPIFPFDPFGPITFYKRDDQINNYNCVTSSVTNIPQFVPEHGYTITKENRIEDKKQYKTPTELTVITHCLDCDCFENCEEINLCSHHDILAEIDGNALVKCAENNLKMIKKEVNDKDSTEKNTAPEHNSPDKGSPVCRCTGCEFFDGYDMCCHHQNFGSITQQSLDRCKKHNLFIEKLIR
jgi:hypothetical protein